MKTEEYLSIVHLAERLKDTIRHCYTSKGRPESVAEHSWRITLMAYLLKDEFPEADINKVIKMCIIHDLGEAFTGDIPVFAKTSADSKKEDELLAQWVDTLSEPFRSEFRDLYEEMNQQKTLEARIYKSMDKLEAVIQHNESDISTWAENEYDLNPNYAWDTVSFSDYLTQLRKTVWQETMDKIRNEVIIYFDMDGVIADFDRGVEELLHLKPRKQEHATAEDNDILFTAMKNCENYYLRLKPMQENVNLVRELKDKGYSVEILTGIPSVKRNITEAADNKRQWIRQYIGGDITVHTVSRKDKKNYCKGPNTILIDDYTANISQWIKQGGRAILYCDPALLRKQLEEWHIS